MELRFSDPTPRRFLLWRNNDNTGISGTGLVASGCAWPDGTVALHWNTYIDSTTIFRSIEDLIALHGHNGDTEVIWGDGVEHRTANIEAKASIGADN